MKKTREYCLRWFGYVQRVVTNVLIRKLELIQSEGMKNGRGRLKKTLVEVVKNEMSIKK